MGLSASQARKMLLTAKRHDLEFRAQQISQRRLALASQLEEIATEYEDKCNNRQMKIQMYYADGDPVEGGKQNLTYSALISGNYDNCGLVQVLSKPDTNIGSHAYSLTDGKNIIVSDYSEIPGFDSDGTCKVKSGDIEGGGTVSDGNITYDQMVGSYEYGSSDRAVYQDKTTKQDVEDSTLAKYKWTKNSDGSITVSMCKGPGSDPNKGDYEIIGRYKVDSALKTAEGSDPNYLQDCLRNGKYLIQETKLNADTGKGETKTISWESTAIYDTYYTDDDAAAKAKYDRLQNEISSQDKKLELELDQIETQRKAVTTEEESVKKVIEENIEKTFKLFA